MRTETKIRFVILGIAAVGIALIWCNAGPLVALGVFLVAGAAATKVIDGRP